MNDNCKTIGGADQILNGKTSFDYRLRPGVVQKSNALELMRLVGLDVTGETGT